MKLAKVQLTSLRGARLRLYSVMTRRCYCGMLMLVLALVLELCLFCVSLYDYRSSRVLANERSADESLRTLRYAIDQGDRDMFLSSTSELDDILANYEQLQLHSARQAELLEVSTYIQQNSDFVDELIDLNAIIAPLAPRLQLLQERVSPAERRRHFDGSQFSSLDELEGILAEPVFNTKEYSRFMSALHDIYADADASMADQHFAQLGDYPRAVKLYLAELSSLSAELSACAGQCGAELFESFDERLARASEDFGLSHKAFEAEYNVGILQRSKYES